MDTLSWQTDACQTEGAATFHTGQAFFRNTSQTGRDLAVLAASIYRQNHGHLRVLDAMTGCGVRPLRYVLEASADFVWANEGNWELHDCLQANLVHSLEPQQYRITHQDANAVFFDCYQRKDFYDLIDVDCFGSPMPALANSLWAIKLGGLLYLTSTDGRATSGRAPSASLQTYGAYARAHPAVHEQGLRLLLGAVMQQAAARGLGAQPVFCWYQGEVNRVMVRIVRQTSWDDSCYGFLSYCHGCGQFGTVGWKKLGRQVRCYCQAETPPVLSGPMWLGQLHDAKALIAMSELAATWQQKRQPSHQDSQPGWAFCHEQLAILQAEAALPPYHYPLAEIGRRGKMDIPPRDQLITMLRQQGFGATRTHLNPQAIKTDAPIRQCIQIARQVAQSSLSPE
ncbi:MAG: tRNA (guanine-N1)-methyltransferase [Cyanobacteria bacterium J06559_1]